MENIWIIGTGRFGLLALERLSRKHKKAHFVLADPEEKNFELMEGPNRALKKADGVAFLKERLDGQEDPDWIIPAVPVHLAAEWCLRRLGPEQIRRIDIPEEIDPMLPNPMRGDSGNIYISHATFLCPDDCPEPRDICTVTGEARKRNLFEVLGEIQLPDFASLVVRSHQLGPGVGGYRPRQLFDLLAQVEAATGNVLVSTACRCHGVMTGMGRLSA